MKVILKMIPPVHSLRSFNWGQKNPQQEHGEGFAAAKHRLLPQAMNS